MVIAYHLILTGYGHWLPNDPRGSRSSIVRAGKILNLAPAHQGRRDDQPSRESLKSFHQEAQHRLEHPVVWFDDALRKLIADAFADVVRQRRYTCFACAILSNHAHLVIRKHRDKSETMVVELKKASAARLRNTDAFAPAHPVWSSDVFKKFLSTGDDVRRTVAYVKRNPTKGGLDAQDFAFVNEYQGEWERVPRQSQKKRP